VIEDVLRYRGIMIRCGDDAYERLVRFLMQPDYEVLSRMSNCRPLVLKAEGRGIQAGEEGWLP
jgi:hypothetical protein